MAEEEPQQQPDPPSPTVDNAAAPAADAAASQTPAPDAAAAEAQSPDAAPGESLPAGDASQATEPAVDEAVAAVEAGIDSATTSAAEIEELLKQANFEDPANMAGVAIAAPEAMPFKMPDIQQVMQDAQVSSIDLLRDVELNVKIELGRSRMLVEDVLKLSEGSVVELDKLAGDPVDVFVNERLVARGEVLVLNDNFCVRVNEIVAGVKEEGT